MRSRCAASCARSREWARRSRRSYANTSLPGRSRTTSVSRRRFPPGSSTSCVGPGLGRRRLDDSGSSLGSKGPTELRAAIEAGRLQGVKGFGDRKIEQIRTALGGETRPSGAPDSRFESVYPTARRIAETLRTRSPAREVAIAGELPPGTRDRRRPRHPGHVR